MRKTQDRTSLSNRYLNARLGSTISDIFDKDMGEPQGSILSVTSFSLKIISQAMVLKNDTLCSKNMFVDDFVFC